MAFVRSTARAVVCVMALALVATASAEIVTETYEYDAAGRLRGVEWSGTGLGYAYDAAGNLLARSVPEPADGLGAAALAAIVWLARQRRRRRAAGIALALLGAGFAAPAGAHFCKSPNIEMVVGQTLDDVFAIDADFEEDVSLYTTTSINPPGFVTVVPAGPNYQSHDLFVNLQANTVANGTVQIFWDYPPNFASGSCVFNVNVKATGQTTSNADHRNSGLAGDPVNTLTGEFVMQEPPDLALPGPMPVFFQRYYGSALQRLFVTSKLGINWRHNYDWTIHFNGNTLTVKDARGRVTRWLQTDTINHVWTQQNNLDLPLTVRQEVLPTENYFHILDPRTNHIYKFGVPEDADRYYLIEIRDGRGNALALTHSLDGELETVTDGLGRTLTFLYRPWNLGGWLQSVSDGTRTVTFTTNGSGLLQGVTDAAGESWAYAYTTNNFDQGLMTSKTWPEGNMPWTQTWDTQSRVATQTTAAGEITTFAYGAGATTISDPRSNDATLAHDGSGRLTETTDAANRTRAIEYAGAGNRSAVEQPSGARHLRTHDPASQNESSVTNAAGQTVGLPVREPRGRARLLLSRAGRHRLPRRPLAALRLRRQRQPDLLHGSRGGHLDADLQRALAAAHRDESARGDDDLGLRCGRHARIDHRCGRSRDDLPLRRPQAHDARDATGRRLPNLRLGCARSPHVFAHRDGRDDGLRVRRQRAAGDEGGSRWRGRDLRLRRDESPHHAYGPHRRGHERRLRRPRRSGVGRAARARHLSVHVERRRTARRDRTAGRVTVVAALRRERSHDGHHESRRTEREHRARWRRPRHVPHRSRGAHDALRARRAGARRLRDGPERSYGVVLVRRGGRGVARRRRSVRRRLRARRDGQPHAGDRPERPHLELGLEHALAGDVGDGSARTRDVLRVRRAGSRLAGDLPRRSRQRAGHLRRCRKRRPPGSTPTAWTSATRSTRTAASPPRRASRSDTTPDIA